MTQPQTAMPVADRCNRHAGGSDQVKNEMNFLAMPYAFRAIEYLR